jgi:hypothetical protein
MLLSCCHSCCRCCIDSVGDNVMVILSTAGLPTTDKPAVLI